MLSAGLMSQCQLRVTVTKVEHLRRSCQWHDVEGSQKIASQTPIDVYSGDEGAHPEPA
jgi:hypothetical protein